MENTYPNILSGTGFADPAHYLKPAKLLLRDNLPRAGIHIHLYNAGLFPEFFEYLKDFPYPFDLFITVVDEKLESVLKNTFTAPAVPMLGKRTVLRVENRGRDVAPWVVDMAPYQKDYDLFCHVHSKKSSQYGPGEGDRWRKYLLDNLIARDAVIDLFHLFQEDPKLGVVFPKLFSAVLRAHEYYGTPLEGEFGEPEMIEALLRRMGFGQGYSRSDVMYSAGTMFWYRPRALKALFDLHLKTEDFPEEPIGPGGTLAHAIERIPAVVAERSGFHSGFFNEVEEDPASAVAKAAPAVSVNLMDAKEVAKRIGLQQALRICREAAVLFLKKKTEG